jgi:hypothetical protein
VARVSRAHGSGSACGAADDRHLYVTIGVIAPDNLTIISMSATGDLENFNHIVNGIALLMIGLLSSAATQTQMTKQGIA